MVSGLSLVLGFRVKGLGCRIYGLRFGILGSGCRISGFRVWTMGPYIGLYTGLNYRVYHRYVNVRSIDSTFCGP